MVRFSAKYDAFLRVSFQRYAFGFNKNTVLSLLSSYFVLLSKESEKDELFHQLQFLDVQGFN